MAGRESGRIKEAIQKRILDEDTRKRRHKKALEALERDNFHEDPHADLGKFSFHSIFLPPKFKLYYKYLLTIHENCFSYE